MHEGFGLPVLEAMQNGCPVISYDNSSIPEVAGDIARLVPTRDITTLVNEIIKIYSNKDLREKLQKAGEHQAQKYTWNSYVESLFKAILEK